VTNPVRAFQERCRRSGLRVFFENKTEIHPRHRFERRHPVKHYQALGWDSSARILEDDREDANDAGCRLSTRFFNLETLRGTQAVRRIQRLGVFFHLEELHSVCEAIREA